MRVDKCAKLRVECIEIPDQQTRLVLIYLMELGCFEYLIYCTMNYRKFYNTYVCKREGTLLGVSHLSRLKDLTKAKVTKSTLPAWSMGIPACQPRLEMSAIIFCSGRTTSYSIIAEYVPPDSEAHACDSTDRCYTH